VVTAKISEPAGAGTANVQVRPDCAWLQPLADAETALTVTLFDVLGVLFTLCSEKAIDPVFGDTNADRAFAGRRAFGLLPTDGTFTTNVTEVGADDALGIGVGVEAELGAGVAGTIPLVPPPPPHAASARSVATRSGQRIVIGESPP
jgi:hypothetical protein